VVEEDPLLEGIVLLEADMDMEVEDPEVVIGVVVEAGGVVVDMGEELGLSEVLTTGLVVETTGVVVDTIGVVVDTIGEELVTAGEEVVI